MALLGMLVQSGSEPRRSAYWGNESMGFARPARVAWARSEEKVGGSREIDGRALSYAAIMNRSSRSREG